MKSKIEEVQAEGTKDELPIGFVTSFFLTVLAALAVIHVWELVGLDRMSYIPRFFVVPWILAASQEIVNGLNVFSGRPLELVSTPLRFAALGGMLLIAVLGPTLFLLEMRARAIARHSSRISWPRNTASIVGAVITVPVVCIILLAAPIQNIMFSELKEVQPSHRNLFFMVYGLKRIAWDVFQYRVKPKSMGRGGGGSVVGYTLSPDLETNPYAHYSVGMKEENVEVLARSTFYPEVTITVTISEKGTMSNWRQKGEFGFELQPDGFWTSLKRFLLSY